MSNTNDHDSRDHTDDTAEDHPAMEILDPGTALEVNPIIAAEINQQVATAKRYPRRRDQEISTEIMSRAVLNEQIASECMYALKRGDKQITGPSIRFAEIVRASYGNIRVAARFVRLDLDEKNYGAVVVEAVAFDMQTNSSEIIPVRRSVMTSAKAGRAPRLYSADMINTTVNAASSIARRNAVLAVVPKAIWIDAYQRVVRVLKGEVVTLAQRRQTIIEKFGSIGVAAERVFEALGVKSIEDITIEHMPALVGFMTAIAEGESPDTVLGRAEGAVHETVEHPLREDQPQGQGINSQRPTAEQVSAAPEGRAEVKPKPEPKAEVPKPTTSDGYRGYALAQIANHIGTKKTLREWWNGERQLRKDCAVAEEVLIEVSAAKDARLVALPD